MLGSSPGGIPPQRSATPVLLEYVCKPRPNFSSRQRHLRGGGPLNNHKERKERRASSLLCPLCSLRLNISVLNQRYLPGSGAHGVTRPT
jgi:hypothetical protein